ncbi:MAG: NAD-binding protein [Christensenellales bacterium]|jgi:Trk K+ transport system NAD-binding subunit
MKLFSKIKKPLSGVVIIGCNRTGIALAQALMAQGFITTLVDKSPDAFKLVPSEYMGNVVLGDATDGNIIADAYFQAAKAIYVVTASDNTNIFITQILRLRLGIDTKIISRLNDPERAEAYAAFSMETVSVENIFANEISRGLCSLWKVI